MPSSLRTVLRARFLALLIGTTLFAGYARAQTGLVISQVYGGGGNTGAPLSYDFIELYNPTATAINLNGLSVQYASSTGSSWTNLTVLPNVALAPGHYFLIQEAEGTTVTNKPLPTSDATGNINLSGTTGKVALVNGATALTGTCPTANVLDSIGYGTANCPAANTAPVLTNLLADIRQSYTGVNATDFTAASPNPRNSSYGGGSSSLSAVGSATPSSVTSNSTTLLTVTVTPAPASTGITVTADLSGILGVTTQTFYDDGTHGDATAGDNVFSYSTVATSSTSKTYFLPVRIRDTQSDTFSTSISLTVNLPVPTVAIHTIQGSRSLSGTSVSPYAGQTVTTQGIVTGVGTAGFFIQTPDSAEDSDPFTPEGVYVYSGTGNVPSTAVVGNYVQVTGDVSTYPAVTASHTPATEIAATSATVIATSQPLPQPIVITSSMLTPSGGLYQLTPYEGMRISIGSLTAVSGTGGTLTSEVIETERSTGQFYAVISGTQRPFREPGVDIRDSQAGLPPNVAHFDDNPERILVDSSFLGGSSVDVSAGAILPNVTGVLDFMYSSDSYYDPSRLLLDPAYSRAQVVAGVGVTPAPAPAGNEFRVAGYNVERFFNPSSSDDIDYNPVTQKTERSSAVDVTPAAYARRLAKVSLAVRHVLNNPDIVGLEEVENQSVAADIAGQISSDAAAAGEPDPKYVAYGTGTSYAPYTNDIGGISVGFLVKSGTVDTLNVQQLGAADTFADPRNPNTQQTLNDRPPLVLHAGIKRAGASDYPVTVIANHLRSLSSETDSASGIFVRTKKELQAEYLAKLIQGYQAAGEQVVSVGDYNVFQFSDGYVDVLATITNQNVLPPDQVLQPGASGLVTPPALDLIDLLPPDQQWSYQEFGNAQSLDHIVATSELVAHGAHVAYAHFDADQPLVSYNDPTTPARESDHDVPVGYFTLPVPALSASLTGNGAFGAVTYGNSSAGSVFVLSNTGQAPIAISKVASSGDFSQTNNCPSSLDVAGTCSVNVVFTPSATGPRSGSLVVTTNTPAGDYTAPLSGSGVAANVTAAVLVKSSTFVYNRVAGTGTETVIVTNKSGATLAGPLELELAPSNPSITPVSPYWLLNGALAPGASATVTVTFKYPLGTSFTTTPTLYSGGLLFQ